MKFWGIFLLWNTLVKKRVTVQWAFISTCSALRTTSTKALNSWHNRKVYRHESCTKIQRSDSASQGTMICSHTLNIYLHYQIAEPSPNNIFSTHIPSEEDLPLRSAIFFKVKVHTDNRTAILTLSSLIVRSTFVIGFVVYLYLEQSKLSVPRSL